MTDRETPDAEPGDGLDAWLAANFPPTPDESKPVESKPVESSPEEVKPEESSPEEVKPEEPPLPPVVDAALPGPPEPGVPDAPTEVFGTVGEASALDDLFGEGKFRDYEAGPDPSESPFAAQTVAAQTVAAQTSAAGTFAGGTVAIATPDAAVRRPPTEGISRTQKVLLWVGSSLVAVLALVALFLIGTKLSDLLGPAPAIVAPTSASPSPSPSPTPTAAPVGPVDPGDYQWDELLGGECLDPYPGPWAEDFTVVDCAVPHPAQVVARGTFAETTAAETAADPSPSAAPGGEPGSGYPGVEALQAQINLLCTTPTVINYATAGKYTDIQFEASYPATEQQWADGDREYYCFVSRTSGEPITGTVAVAPAPAP